MSKFEKIYIKNIKKDISIQLHALILRAARKIKEKIKKQISKLCKVKNEAV